MPPFAFHTAPSVHVGWGSAGGRFPELAALVGERALVVVDPTVHRLGLADSLVENLKEERVRVAIYAGVSPEPPEAEVRAAGALARDHGATGVVGFGGGSAMDVAKVTALIAGSGQSLNDLYGVDRAMAPRLPLALVPTTAGTGSEVTPVAILTANGVKRAIVSRHLVPDLALLDAALTAGLPASATAASGIDAISHAIESFASASRNRSLLSRGLARQALRLLGAHLARVVFDGADREARQAMLLGSFLAGQAFANAPVAAVHALAYPLGSRFHLPHGVAIALLLPHVLRFNLPTAAADYAEIAPDLFPALATLAEEERALGLITGLHGLIADIGLPTTLLRAGVDENALPAMADEALLQTRLLVNNPRPVDRGDALDLYRRAWA